MPDQREPFSSYVRAFLIHNNLVCEKGPNKGRPSLGRINSTILDNLFDEFHEKANNWEKQQRAKKRTRSLVVPTEKEQIPPKREDVERYCKECGYTFSLNGFFGHYESNGWRVGKLAMVSWKGACRTFQGDAPKRPTEAQKLNADARSAQTLPEPEGWKERLSMHDELSVHVGRDWDTLLPYYRQQIVKACQ